jgi:hypothetical protein
MLNSHFIVNNILEGLIWFFVPASLVICNDVMAYVCGKPPSIVSDAAHGVLETSLQANCLVKRLLSNLVRRRQSRASLERSFVPCSLL